MPQITLAYLQESGEFSANNIFPNPAQSTDMKAIEHVWYHLKLQMNKHSELPESIAEHKVRVILGDWDKIDINSINVSIVFILDRVSELYKSKGQHIKY